MPEDKIARICWNSTGWQKPSGLGGKSRNKESYEYQHSYGHEEWLLDTEKVIDGYHYGYLQAIGAHHEKYVGKIFNISLYSINDKTKERWWIGEIKNVSITTPEESKKVYKIYKKNRWLKEMEFQLHDVDADYEAFNQLPPKYFSTIKFKPSDAILLDEPRRFSYGDPAVTSDYYNLKNKVKMPIFIENEFEFVPGHNEGEETSRRSYSSSGKSIDLFHNRMQTAIFEQLCEQHGEDNVGTEVSTGFGTRVDVAVRTKNEKYVFYELKTSNILRQCIRDGLSQLLEYSFFPNMDRASKLIIVSQNRIDGDNIRYLKSLRKRFDLPVYYQQFDTVSSRLIGYIM